MALFDLEIQNVSQISEVGVEKLSNIFYGETDLITNAIWNNVFTVDSEFYKKTPSLFKRFNNLDRIECTNYISHIVNSDGFEIYKILLKRGSTILLWTSGIAKFFKTQIQISNNNFRELPVYDSLFDRYFIPIGTYADPTSISIVLNKTTNNTLDISREFVSTNIVSTVTSVSIAPKTARKYSIFISNNKLYCARYNNKVIFISDITTITNWNEYKISMENNETVYDSVNNKVFIKEDNVIYDYQHKLSFLASPNNYKYVTEQDPYSTDNLYTIYIARFNRAYIMEELENKLLPYKNTYNFLNESPYELVDIKYYNNIGDELSSIDFTVTVIRDTIKIYNDSGTEAICKISYNVIPLVSFNRAIWPIGKDVRHFLADFSPNITSFTNGTVCLYNKESNMSLKPAALSIKANKNILETYGNIKVMATLKDSNGIPLSGRQVNLEIIDDIFDAAKWAGDADTIYQAKTNMCGEINGTLISSQLRFGWCLQKEWAGDVVLSTDKKFISYNSMGIPNRDPLTRNRLYVPFKIGTNDPNRIYLYMITGDDPILGIVTAYWNSQTNNYVENEHFTGTKVKEFYDSSGNLSSYELAARRIANISLVSNVNSDNTISVITKFKKPKSIVNLSDKEIIVRNSIIHNRFLENGNKNGAIDLLTKYQESGSIKDFTVVEQMVTTYSNTRLGWDNKWLLSGQENKISYIRVKPDTCSYIEFDGEVPGIDDPNVIGYFIVTDLGGSLYVQATSIDETTDVELKSEILKIDVESYIKSESAFTLAQNKPYEFDVNNFIGTFGYMTVSDYIKSPFGINSCSMICRHSDGKYSCLHDSVTYIQNTTTESQIIITPETHGLGESENLSITIYNNSTDEVVISPVVTVLNVSGTITVTFEEVPIENQYRVEMYLSYREVYFIPEENFGGMWCGHTVDEDISITHCPGLEPRLVNPFLLHVDNK